MTTIAFLVLLLAADPAAPTSAVPADVLEVHDGDTLIVTLHLPFDVDLPKRTIRAYGYDAWEISKIRQTVVVTDEEIQKGKLALVEFKALLASGTLYCEDSRQRDPYGRTSAILWVQAKTSNPKTDDPKITSWIYVAAWMEQHGHLRTPRLAAH